MCLAQGHNTVMSVLTGSANFVNNRLLYLVLKLKRKSRSMSYGSSVRLVYFKHNDSFHPDPLYFFYFFFGGGGVHYSAVPLLHYVWNGSC